MSNTKPQFTQSIKKGSMYDDNQYNKDGSMVNNANSVTIKGKLFNIEEEVNNLQVDLNGNLSDVQLIETDKNSVNSILKTKLHEVHSNLTNQLDTIEDWMRKYFEDQKKENNNYIKQLQNLKKEKNEITSNINSLEARLKCLEDNIGEEEI